MLRQAVRLNSLTELALTKLDILDGFDTIKICTGYRLNGKVYDYLPAHAAEQAAVEPIYEEMPGWQETTAGARSWMREISCCSACSTPSSHATSFCGSGAGAVGEAVCPIRKGRHRQKRVDEGP